MPEAKAVKRGFFRGGLTARRNPYPLMLILAMVGSSLMFLLVIAILIARKYTVGFDALPVPNVFYFSTGFIAASSVTMYLSRVHYQAEQFRQHLNWAGISLVLGLVFAILQLLGWWELLRAGYTLKDSTAASFLFLLSGLHLTHMFAALALVGWAVADSSRNRNYVDGFIQSIDPAKRTRMQLGHWFWHFTDVLWLLLFLVITLMLAY